jgi:hypothetical protein
MTRSPSCRAAGSLSDSTLWSEVPGDLIDAYNAMLADTGTAGVDGENIRLGGHLITLAEHN